MLAPRAILLLRGCGRLWPVAQQARVSMPSAEEAPVAHTGWAGGRSHASAWAAPWPRHALHIAIRCARIYMQGEGRGVLRFIMSLERRHAMSRAYHGRAGAGESGLSKTDCGVMLECQSGVCGESRLDELAVSDVSPLTGSTRCSRAFIIP